MLPVSQPHFPWSLFSLRTVWIARTPPLHSSGHFPDRESSRKFSSLIFFYLTVLGKCLLFPSLLFPGIYLKPYLVIDAKFASRRSLCPLRHPTWQHTARQCASTAIIACNTPDSGCLHFAKQGASFENTKVQKMTLWELDWSVEANLFKGFYCCRLISITSLRISHMYFDHIFPRAFPRSTPPPYLSLTSCPSFFSLSS